MEISLLFNGYHEDDDDDDDDGDDKCKEKNLDIHVENKGSCWSIGPFIVRFFRWGTGFFYALYAMYYQRKCLDCRLRDSWRLAGWWWTDKETAVHRLLVNSKTMIWFRCVYKIWPAGVIDFARAQNERWLWNGKCYLIHSKSELLIDADGDKILILLLMGPWRSSNDMLGPGNESIDRIIRIEWEDIREKVIGRFDTIDQERFFVEWIHM